MGRGRGVALDVGDRLTPPATRSKSVNTTSHNPDNYISHANFSLTSGQPRTAPNDDGDDNNIINNGANYNGNLPTCAALIGRSALEQCDCIIRPTDDYIGLSTGR